MTLETMKKKVLRLIEEIDNSNPLLTADTDIQNKINDVINQIQYEICRIKKIPRKIVVEVLKGDVMEFSEIIDEIYQVYLIRGVDAEILGTEVIFNEAGSATVYYYAYPVVITSTTLDTYIFELSSDVLEIMPYGIAADLLKSDVSAEYGNIYANRYNSMLKGLDPRYHTGKLSIEGTIEWGSVDIWQN